MNTQEFLDKINGAIAEAFAPIINKPREYRAGLHETVKNAIENLLPKDLAYEHWYLRAGQQSHVIDINLFELKVNHAFQEYKSKSTWKGPQGKWIAAPHYEVLPAVAASTLEEVIRRGYVQHYEAKIFTVNELINQAEKELLKNRLYLETLLNEYDKYSFKTHGAHQFLSIDYKEILSHIEAGRVIPIGSNLGQINNQGEYSISRDGTKIYKRRHSASKVIYDLIATAKTYYVHNAS